MSPRRKGEEFASRCALALLIVLTLIVVSTAFAFLLVSSKLNAAERVDLTLAPAPSGGGANYLMIGSDSRSFIADPTDAKRFGTDVGGQRSDTIMVLHFDPDSERSLLVSFPRDLWVDVPNRGTSRLNAAFNDGPQSIIDTLASNFDVPVHHYVEVNFDTFRQLVNAIGRLNVYFPVAARDPLTGLGMATPLEGCVALDGEGALAYVRARNLELRDPDTGEWEDADPIPDLGRIVRQQAFLRALGQKAMNSALTNPFDANDIGDAAVEQLKIDQEFGRTDVFRLAAGFSAEEGEIGPASITVPTESVTRDGQSVLEATDEAESVFAQLRDFDTVVPTVTDGEAVEDVTVRVLNASGVSGAAAGALAGLEAHGFKGAGVGNSGGLQTTEVRYRPGNEAQADLVANLVVGSKQKVEDDTINADVVLVIGESFGGIAEVVKSAPTTDPPDDVQPAQPASLAPVPGGC